MATRTFSTIAAATAMVLGLSACGSDSGSGGTEEAEDVTLTWANTGGQEAERERAAFQEPFTEETGIKIEDVAFSNLIAQLQMMVESGEPVWDIVNNVPYIALQYCGELLEEVDYSDFPDDIWPEDTTTECTRPAGKFAFVFAYDTEVYTDEVPTSLADFFDTETFPGKRVIRGNNPRAYLEAALVADGVDPDDLYPLDVGRALSKFDTIKSELIFAPSLSAIQQALSSKQAAMSITHGPTLGQTYDAGSSMAPVWDVSFWDFNVFMVVKGTPHKDEAVEAIKFTLQPDALIEFTRLGGNTPVRTDIDPATIEFEEGTEFNPFIDDDRGELTLMSTEWWSDNLEATSDAWVAWQSG